MAQKSQNDNKKASLAAMFLSYLSNTAPGLMFIHLAWMVVACCALSFSYIAAFHFTSLLNIYQEAHNIRNFDENLRASAIQNTAINVELTKLLNETNSNRTYVFRYHNGLAAVSGVPFFFQTMTHEIISPGVSRVMRFEQHVPASMHMAVSNQFMRNRCAIVDHADSDVDSQNYWYFQTRNAKSLVRCPIFMPNGDLFGFVGIDWVADMPEGDLANAANLARETARAVALIFLRR